MRKDCDPTDVEPTPSRVALDRQRLLSLSNEELGAIIEACERAIATGSAEVEDFESFVLAQKELARRTWA